MTIQKPLWLENLENYTATDMRRLLQELFPSPGCFEQSDLAVAQHGAGAMSVDVAAGSAIVAGTSAAGQGSYLFTSDATTTLTIPPAPGAGPSRYDLVVVKIEDADQDGGPNDDGILEVIEGTAAATGSQVAPAAPASSLILSRVLVGPAVSTILTASIGDFRRFAHGTDVSIGDAKMVLVASLPGPGWEWANGAAVSRAAYAAAFSAMGTAWGVGDGSTTFNKPNLVNFFPVGAGSTYALAGTGGEATHVLSTGEIPAHNHTLHDPGHDHIPEGPASQFAVQFSPSSEGESTPGTGDLTYQPATAAAATGVTIDAAGGGGAHNNLPPYKGVNFAVLMR